MSRPVAAGRMTTSASVRLVNVVNPVRREEGEPAEIFEHAQKHADDRLHRHVVIATLDVNVGVLDQHDGAPALGAHERDLERVFHRGDAEAELAGMHAVERPANDFGTGVGGQCLADSQRSRAQDRGAPRIFPRRCRP